MQESQLSEEAGQQYASAYDTHCTAKDIHNALSKIKIVSACWRSGKPVNIGSYRFGVLLGSKALLREP